jgi:hypothetical protein
MFLTIGVHIPYSPDPSKWPWLLSLIVMSLLFYLKIFYSRSVRAPEFYLFFADLSTYTLLYYYIRVLGLGLGTPSRNIQRLVKTSMDS